MTTSDLDRMTSDHPGDGALLALFDGERDDARATELDCWRRHADACDACRARLETIAARSARVRELLESIPVPAVGLDEFRARIPRRGARTLGSRRHMPWQVAAGIVLVAGAAVAATTAVRGWIERRGGDAAPAHGATVEPLAHAAPSAEPVGTTISFAATGPEFTVRLDSIPASGVLEITRTNSGEISAQVTSGAGTGGDAMVVLPGELRIRNTTTSRTSYRVSVPRLVAQVRVIVAGELRSTIASNGSLALHRAP